MPYLVLGNVFQNILHGVFDARQSVWLPSSLYVSGEKGTWFNPSVLTGVFTDTAGTTQAVVNDPVARVNDLSGNASNATQATLGSRPLFGRVPANGRKNLITYSEQLDITSAWSVANVSITPNVDGTADKMTELATTSVHYISQNATIPAAGRCTASVEAKLSVGTRWFIIRANNDGANYWIVCNLQDGTISQVGPSVTASSITALSDGYYSITMSWSSPADTLSGVIFGLSNSATPGTGTPSYAGDGTSAVLIRNAQFEFGPSATAYQRVGSTYDVTQVGQDSRWYLANVSTDTIEWSAVAGTYTIAYRGNTGSVILDAQTLSGTTNVMLSSKIYEYIVVQRALGSVERSRLLNYFNQKYALV